jgi:hypothetical protein
MSKLTIDLSGQQGNAFYLMGLVRSFGRQLSLSKEETDSIIQDMKAGDYDHLVKVFARNFDVVVDIYNKDGSLYVVEEE